MTRILSLQQLATEQLHPEAEVNNTSGFNSSFSIYC
jgi:hypothetical protein